MLQVTLAPTAQKSLDKLDDATAIKILNKLAELSDHPEPHAWLKKLEGFNQNLFRIHIGRDWVAVGKLQSSEFEVLLIGNRKDIYMRLRRQI